MLRARISSPLTDDLGDESRGQSRSSSIVWSRAALEARANRRSFRRFTNIMTTATPHAFLSHFTMGFERGDEYIRAPTDQPRALKPEASDMIVGIRRRDEITASDDQPRCTLRVVRISRPRGLARLGRPDRAGGLQPRSTTSPITHARRARTAAGAWDERCGARADLPGGFTRAGSPRHQASHRAGQRPAAGQAPDPIPRPHRIR